jgi:integrase
VVVAHLIPGLGRITLTKLSAADVLRYQRVKLASGLSAATVRYHRIILRVALGKAVKWHLTTINAAALADPPKAVRHEIQPFNPEETRAFLTAVHGHRLEALYVCAVALGMRQGELLGLRWDDVDLDACVLHVRHQMQRIGGKLVLTQPKTERSRRTIALPELVIEALRWHRTVQLRERLLAGSRWQENRLIFSSGIGTGMDGSYIAHQFGKIIKDAGLRRVRFHDLRHGCAALLIHEGVDLRGIMDLLGHSSIAVTGDIYGHMSHERRRVIAGVMDHALAATG